MKDIITYINEAYSRFRVSNLLEKLLPKISKSGKCPAGIKIINLDEKDKKEFKGYDEFHPFSIGHIIKYIQSNGERLSYNASRSGDYSFVKNTIGNIINAPKLKVITYVNPSKSFTDRGAEASREYGNDFGTTSFDMTLDFNENKINIKYDVIGQRRGNYFVTIKDENDKYDIDDFIVFINKKINN